MRILLIYSTRHGSSEKIANKLKALLKGDLVLHNLKKKFTHDLNEFDSVILGGSIHAGEISHRIKKFIGHYQPILLQKQLGLFLCCMDKEKDQIQFDNAFNEELRGASLANGLFGGEFIFEKMNWFESLAVKKIAGVHTSISEIDETAITNFASKFNSLSR